MVADGPMTDLHAPVHPSRRALHRVLTDPDDEASWDSLADAYDEMSDIWTDWAEGEHEYLDPVKVGLEYAKPAELVLEVACGTGQATVLLDAYTRTVLATDVNLSMLADAPTLPNTRYVVADVRRLPARTGSVPLLVGLNGIPHIGEFTRVLAPDGQLLWCTSFGAGTPLYVPPEQLLELFGPSFRGEAGRAGHGEWLLLSREG